MAASSGWRKYVPLEIAPLAVFTAFALSFASYRLYKMSCQHDVQFFKRSHALIIPEEEMEKSEQQEGQK